MASLRRLIWLAAACAAAVGTVVGGMLGWLLAG
jgi:membrane protein YqaA with SNARE-associated domain